MPRQIKKDFDKLLEFVDNYALNGIVDDQFKKSLSSIHKKYYSFLTITILLSDLADKENNEDTSKAITHLQYLYLVESCSDIAQALISAIQGCYKGANLLIRSSIENFVKAYVMDENSEIHQIKSVYEIFDKAKVANSFSGNRAPLFDTIHQNYAELCSHVHTAGLENMEQILSLATYPRNDKDKFADIENVLLRSLKAFVTLLCLKYNDYYLNCPADFKDIILESIISNYKKEINKITI